MIYEIMFRDDMVAVLYSCKIIKIMKNYDVMLKVVKVQKLTDNRVRTEITLNNINEDCYVLDSLARYKPKTKEVYINNRSSYATHCISYKTSPFMWVVTGIKAEPKTKLRFETREKPSDLREILNIT